MTHPVDHSPAANEARLVAASKLSPLGLESTPRVDMTPAAIETRLQVWAELTTLCLELAAGATAGRS